MRILYITSNYRPVTTGGAIRCQSNAEEWTRLGHDVTVVTNFPNTPKRNGWNRFDQRPYQVESLNGVRVVRVPSIISQSKSTIGQLAEFLSFMISAIFACLFLRRTQVVVASSPQLFCGMAGWVASLFHWRPFVFEVRDLWPDSIAALKAVRRSWALAPLFWLEKFLYGRAAKVIAVTGRAASEIEAKGVSNQKIRVIYNGADMVTLGRPAQPIQQKLDGKFVVSYIGTMGVAQRPDLILQAAQLLMQDAPEIHFLIVGGGVMQPNMQKEVRERGLNNISFAPTVPHDRIPDYWAASDATISLLKDNNTFDGVIPSKIYEAFGTKTPLVTNVSGAISEIVDQSEAMVLIPSDAKSLAEALIRIKANPENTHKMIGVAYEVAVKFDRKTLAREMADVLGAIDNDRA